jgi:urease accessory protein
MEIESHAQGNAFIDAICAAWPSNQLSRISSYLKQDNKNIPYSVAVALVSAIHGIALGDALTAYLNAFSSNLVSAGVRLIPIGQTMGLKVLAGLADTILTVKEISLTSSPKNMGSATLVVDWTSARHETQYTRLFRS